MKLTEFVYLITANFFVGNARAFCHYIVLTTLFITGTLCTQQAFAVTVVCDIDWTLVYHDGEEAAALEPENTMQIGDDHLRFSDYAAEAFELMLRHEIATIFFSGGSEDRNKKVADGLSELTRKKLDVSRPAFPSAGFASLTEVAPASSGLSFSRRLKKDLLKVVSENEILETVLLDDDPRFSFVGQEKHLFSFSSYKDKLSFADYQQTHEQDPHTPPTFEAWFVERSKLLIFAEAVIEVKEARNPAQSFLDQVREALGIIPDANGHMRLSAMTPQPLELLKRGQARLEAEGIHSWRAFIRAPPAAAGSCRKALAGH